MNIILTMSIFYIVYGVLGYFGIQNIAKKYKNHSWTMDYTKGHGRTYILIGVAWLAVVIFNHFHPLEEGMQLFVLLVVLIPGFVHDIFNEQKYKNLLEYEKSK